MNIEERNQKIIDAIIAKEEKLCPGVISLIGINGSFMRGDYYEKSDLDLLIVINEERGNQLSCCFIQEDIGVGHDIYCTAWERLEEMANYEDPYISKLMDAKIVYYSTEAEVERLEGLREKVRRILESPFTKADFIKVDKTFAMARGFEDKAFSSRGISDARTFAGAAIYYVENALALLNKTYFKKGVKMAYEELGAMERRPGNLIDLINKVVLSDREADVKSSLECLMNEAKLTISRAASDYGIGCDGFDDGAKGIREEEKAGAKVKETDAISLTGTYEEMVSNWRNKMHLAAESHNHYLAFMSLVSFNSMIEDLKEKVRIGDYNGLKCYNPGDLKETADRFDRLLEEYLKEYQKVGMEPKKYRDVDEFVEQYLLK